LILPGLLRIRPILTPLAACGLVIIMIGATVVTLVGGEVVPALVPLVVGLHCAAVAYGRRSWVRRSIAAFEASALAPVVEEFFKSSNGTQRRVR
jgi:hypothetical protein